MSRMRSVGDGIELDWDAVFKAARMAGKSPQMDAAAQRVKAGMVADALTSAATGAFADSISVSRDMYRRRRVLDRVISTDDPAALSIEYGHRAGKGEDATYVPGKFVFTNALLRG